MASEPTISLVGRAIDRLNSELPAEERLGKSPEAVVYGGEGGLDSVGLLNLVVAVEEEIQAQFGRAVTVADERAMSQADSPFRTVASLADHVEHVLDKPSHD